MPSRAPRRKNFWGKSRGKANMQTHHVALAEVDIRDLLRCRLRTCKSKKFPRDIDAHDRPGWSILSAFSRHRRFEARLACARLTKLQVVQAALRRIVDLRNASH